MLISRRTQVVAAVTGVPVVAAGLWLAASGPAQAAEKPSSSAVSGASAAPAAAKPNTEDPVLIKAGKFQGKDRILTVEKGGKVSLKRSTPTKSNGLSTEGTAMKLTKVGKKYQIMSLNDSHEIDAYCLQEKQNGTVNIALCDAKKKNQLFTLAPAGKKFTIDGKWGHLEVYKRTISHLPGEHAGPAAKFSIVAQ
ncbi:hypothetical protein [Kineosporia babensis]|uniref:Ricin B lectin domain-containing protein n=1 Tax=Kineosporia babensis TaxID=499548 RepID=A0A9X1SXA5_9ACTN|nr:hypothetical protein [Kineosporia babensis]MCD5315656.1 hypothetical protein [Kineosporia babensis]